MSNSGSGSTTSPMAVVLQGMGPFAPFELKCAYQLAPATAYHCVSSGSIVALVLLLQRHNSDTIAKFAQIFKRFQYLFRLTLVMPMLLRVQYALAMRAIGELARSVERARLDDEVRGSGIRVYANDKCMRRVVLEPKTWSELCSAVDASCNIPYINPTGARLYDGVWIGPADFECETDTELLEVGVPSLRDVLAFFVFGIDASCTLRKTTPSAWLAIRRMRFMQVAAMLAATVLSSAYNMKRAK
jgi:hypothetical protein